MYSIRRGYVYHPPDPQLSELTSAMRPTGGEESQRILWWERESP
jgi:hypothetical protein